MARWSYTLLSGCASNHFANETKEELDMTVNPAVVGCPGSNVLSTGRDIDVGANFQSKSR